MARPRQTDLAVLGALSLGPLSGYALREGIRDVLGQFWSESFGQIYPTLTRLEADGQVERLAGTRRGSSRYALTTAGRDRLRGLLATPVEFTPPRNGLLLRLFFGHELGAAACAALVREHRERATEALASLAASRAETEAEPDSAYRRYALLVISAGEHSAAAALAWADHALAELAEPDGPDEPAEEPDRPRARPGEPRVPPDGPLTL